jgi:IS30 family transposase
MANIEAIAAPLIRKGQPLSHIYAHHRKELGISQRSFYRYVDQGYIGLKNIDMRRVVRYKKRKRGRTVALVPSAKRGHEYGAFLKMLEENPGIRIAEMDMVEGKSGESKKLLTLMIRGYRLMVIVLLGDGTREEVLQALDDMEKALGTDVFNTMFPVILTDNDPAWNDPARFEVNEDGVVRTHLYYCEPRRSDQKGSLEKNHQYIRYVIPKGKSFEALSKKNVQDMMNHINSTARPDLNGESPMEAALREFGEPVLAKLGMRLIPCDEVCLTPQLIRPDEPTQE